MRHHDPRRGVLTTCLMFALASPMIGAASVPSPPPAPGSVIWFDLLTEDADAVTPFYSKLFGWKIEHFEPGAFVVLHQGRPIAGISEIADKEPDVEEAFWLAGIAVSDVDAAVERARKADAVVHREPRNLPGYARYAVISDPQGAPVMLLKPETELGGATGPGAWVWTELWTDDTEAAREFYGSVVGYETATTPVGDQQYEVLKTADTARAGLVAMPFEGVPPAWAPYIAVEDLQKTVDRAVELGGRVLLPPADKLGRGAVALLADPTGGAFFVYHKSSEGTDK